MGIYARSNQNFQDYTFAFCLDQELLHCSSHIVSCFCLITLAVSAPGAPGALGINWEGVYHCPLWA